jgi:hypothetical protein
MGGTPSKEGEGQMVNEVLDRRDAQGRVDIWDGGTPGIVANHTETLGLGDL